MDMLFLGLWFLFSVPLQANNCSEKDYIILSKPVPPKILEEIPEFLELKIEKATQLIEKNNAYFKAHGRFPPFSTFQRDLIENLQNNRRSIFQEKGAIAQKLKLNKKNFKNKELSLESKAELEKEKNVLISNAEALQRDADSIASSLDTLRKWHGLSIFHEVAESLAKDQQVLILLRSIQPEAAGHLIHKGFGKGLAFKFHSADKGVLAGLVPQKQRLSKKVLNDGKGELEKYQKAVDQAIASGEVIAVPFRVGSKVAVERGEKILMVDQTLEKVHPEEIVKVLAVKAPADEYSLIVSDVDPFAFSFANKISSKKITRPKEGILTEDELVIVKKFNRRVAVLLDKDVNKGRYMPHGPENRNPNSSGVSGYPIFAYFPNGKFELIPRGSEQDPDRYLKDFFRRIEKEGHHLEINPLWGWEQ